MAEPSLPFDMPLVEAPSFPDRIFDVQSFGAVGDGITMNTQAFRRAIEACHDGGGGVVLIPAGTWLTGPIHLRSSVHLCLERDALVRFSGRFADYLPVVFTRWEGVECYNYSPLIYARDCENIAVTGEGAFDGQGETWWHWKKLQQAAAKTLYDAEFDGVPVEKRVYGTEEAALRPQFLQSICCRNVLVEGVTFLNGPMWTIHPVYCENVFVRNVTVQTTGPNTDGLNPDSCCNVLVEGCSFSTEDDNVYLENIRMAGLRREAIVLNMFYGSSTAAPRSGAPPVFRNIRIRNVTCESAGVAVAIRGLPEQPIERVALDNLNLNTVEGIRCQDADDLTLSDVSGVVQEEPLFSCSNIRGLNVTNMTLKSPKRRSDL